jgi:hypothetical protein
VLSIVASNPPPVVPGISPGDVLTLTFSSPTATPDVSSDAALLTALQLTFSASVGVGLVGAWSPDGTALSIRVTGVDAGGAPVGGAATAIGTLAAALPQYPVRDAALLSAPLPPPSQTVQVYVTGSWGVVSTPRFLPAGGGGALPAIAYNTGGQAGLGAGDSLLLRFTTPVRGLPLGTTAAVDAVFAFSTPLGRAYSGAWVSIGPYAGAGATITVTRALPAGAAGAGAGAVVGVLVVSVRPSAGLTSLDGSTPPCNDSVVVAAGSWGDVPSVLSLAPASHTRARLAVTYAARGVTAVTLACGPGGGGAAVYAATLPAPPAPAAARGDLIRFSRDLHPRLCACGRPWCAPRRCCRASGRAAATRLSRWVPMSP